ncbi:hypothetical protein K469DRAFT_682941 [Zopfia rhizophila CBS 207.26]|uniref:Uncharacterized protein n=1 Tax=Zopfia rhizophila CBS 207.26 TaxID=1314779 RepID=A0A6A6EE32_9PEZI|nr:hypothetical protein K469DRAFT_682941 [Zopfia rhizophila CBS 207.26]
MTEAVVANSFFWIRSKSGIEAMPPFIYPIVRKVVSAAIRIPLVQPSEGSSSPATLNARRTAGRHIVSQLDGMRTSTKNGYQEEVQFTNPFHPIHDQLGNKSDIKEKVWKTVEDITWESIIHELRSTSKGAQYIGFVGQRAPMTGGWRFL